MKLARVENDEVTNVIEANVRPDWATEDDGYYQITDDSVGRGHRRINGEWLPPLVTPDRVDAERDRRISEGTQISLNGGQLITVIGTDDAALLALSMQASTIVLAGEGATEMTWRDPSNVNHALTAVLIVELWSAWQTFKSAVTTAAWTIKDTDPIPQNYTDAAYWP